MRCKSRLNIRSASVSDYSYKTVFCLPLSHSESQQGAPASDGNCDKTGASVSAPGGQTIVCV